MSPSAPFDINTHAQKYAPEYGEHHFSDHLPMTATALKRLGAPAERIDAFAKVYRRKLKRRRPAKSTIDPLLLSARLGDPTVYPAALNYFTTRISTEGRAHVLAEHLPELTGSLAAAAFHGVIRVAYGLIANSDAEIAAGMAYWYAQAHPIKFGRHIGASNNDVTTLLQDVAATMKKQRRKLSLDQDTISARMDEIFANPALNAVLARTAAADVAFEEIASVALRLFLATEDFTALHCVTGVHATRVLSEHVVMDDAALRKSLWSSLCAAYASIGAPELASLT
ncbi:MAG: questin oxidase family protein, partial [Pseudomonadota bacterium]